MSELRLQFQPATAERWDDLVDLFGPERGACGGCWCMWPFLRARDWKVMAREERRDALKSKVVAGAEPGLLAYREGVAVGWVACGPRERYVRFQLSRTTKPLDDDPEDLVRATHAVTCFYVRSGHRKAGLMDQLLGAAIDRSRQNGAKWLDACPIESDKPLHWSEGFVGFTPVFRRAGFKEIARRSPRRPLMRMSL